MKTIAAFYDIDGTLFRQALSICLFKKLSSNKIIPDNKWEKEIKPLYESWASREGNYDDYILAICKVYKENIIGLNSAVLKFLADQVVKEKGSRLYRHTKTRMAWHKEQGHKIIIISGAPSELAEGLAKQLGVDTCVGTVYKTNEAGAYTGEVIPMWDRNSKLKALKKYVIDFDIDLDQSYAYGDTNGDIAMLASVGHPTIINPTRELLQNVMEDNQLRKKITTIVERKDIIYKLDLEKIDIID